MIHFSADIVLAVRDGFTGRPISQSALLCTLNSAPYKPLLKNGGYIVFTNLSEGEHDIVIGGARYNDERLKITVKKGQCVEKAVSMKPSEKYPFARSVTRLALSIACNGAPAADKEIWVAACNALYEIKIAQDVVKAGERSSRLFSRDKKILEQLPAAYLVCDEKSSEIVEIADLTQETGTVENPFAFSHKRGCSMYPVQKYTANSLGLVSIVFGEPGEIIVFSTETAGLTRLNVTQGENSAEVSL